MFCDKPSVNQLTAALLAYGITDVVVCPGSRNAPLVHDFSECEREGKLRLHLVTDERSAAFVALGLILATAAPVAVCVTSGSALLNTLPATAEAYYRHLPLVVISADRPEEWISQLDGQTIVQQRALEPYAKTYPIGENNLDWNERLLAEALVGCHSPAPRPVHLNVPLSEPLFSFTTKSLPSVKRIDAYFPAQHSLFSPSLVSKIKTARLPLVYIGQIDQQLTVMKKPWEAIGGALIMAEIFSQMKVCEHLTAYEQGVGEVLPDLVIHLGGNGLCKRLKQTLRTHRPEVVRVEEGEGLPDTFRGLTEIIHAPTERALEQLYDLLSTLPAKQAVVEAQKSLRLPAVSQRNLPTVLPQLSALLDEKKNVVLHLANSLSIRYAAKLWVKGEFPIYCNRGTNGIEGSLSTAVGAALSKRGMHYCIIGDLSFFYDGNALWNAAVGGNLRVLLLNNGGGRIFDHLPNLNASPAQGKYISANHHTTARGLCQSYGITYLSARSEEDLPNVLDCFTTAEAHRPIVLEVFV